VVAGLLALLVVSWSVFDLVRGLGTSPLTRLGGLALSPLGFRSLDLLGAGLVLLPLLGMAVVGGSSLEASERRAALVGQMRFAATLQDVRTVLVLRRQLAQERPRSRPWIRIPGGGRRALVKCDWAAGAVSSGTASPTGAYPLGQGRRYGAKPPRPRPAAVTRRSFEGLSRWPLGRIARLLVLEAVAVGCGIGAWNGTASLVAVGGIALYLAGLDAVEPLAQELDHPDRLTTLPHQAGQVRLLLLVVPVVVLAVSGSAVLAAASALVGPEVFEVGLALVLPASLLACCGAAVSTMRGADTPVDSAALTPEIAGMRTGFRVVFPPACGIVALIPVLIAERAASRGSDPVSAATSSSTLIAAGLAFFVLAWVRYREELGAFLAAAGEAGRGGGSAADPSAADG